MGHPPEPEPEPPEVKIVFEAGLGVGTGERSWPLGGHLGDETADRSSGDPGDGPLPVAHLVGHDPLGAVAAAVSETMVQLRQQRSDARVASALATRSSFQDQATERTAQVVQATSVAIDHVIALLVGEVGRGGGLELSGDRPVVRNGVAVFDGVLHLHRPPTRRRIELRVYPTASGNLTVLELLPLRAWMPQTRRYLRAGVPAVTELTDRIEAAIAR